MKKVNISQILTENRKLREENRKLREWLKTLIKCMRRLDESEHASTELKMYIKQGIPSQLFEEIANEVD